MASGEEMDTEKRRTGIFIAAVVVISAFVALCTPASGGELTGPVAIFQDVGPWGYTSNQDILTANGIAYTIYSSADIGVVDLSGFEKVIIASVQPVAFYTTVEANRAWFEQYVNNGGCLEIHATCYMYQPWPTGILPCGFTWQTFLGETVEIALPGHEMLTTPNVITDAELDGWDASYHGYFTGFPAGSELILTEGDTGSASPVLIIAPYGDGCVIATGQTLEYGYSEGYSKLLENVILFTCGAPPTVPEITPIGILALISALSAIAAVAIVRKRR